MKENKEDLLKTQIMSPIANEGDGNVTKEEIGDQEDAQVIVEMLNKEVREAFSPKYQEELNKMAEEDPTSVMIETPEGWMTIAEAIKKGYNPDSGEFDQETVEEMVDRIIKEQGLGPEEAERVRALVLQQQPEEEEVVAAEENTEEPIEEGPKEMEVPTNGMQEKTQEEIDPALLAALSGEGGK